MLDYPTPPTGMTQAELEALYAQLVVAADQARTKFMLQRCPPELLPTLQWHIEQDAMGPPPDPNKATATNGQIVNLQDSQNQPVAATTRLNIANGVIGVCTVLPNSNTTLVSNNAQVVVHDLADADVPGSPGRASVTSSTLQFVKLTV